MLRSRFAFVVAFLTVSATYAAIESPVHKTFAVSPGGKLTIETDVGEIRVNGGGNGVTIDVTRRARNQEALGDLDLSFDQSGSDVHVRAKYNRLSRWFFWGNDLDLRFVITVPSRYNLQLTTSGGDVRVGDLQGEVRCRTSGGSIGLGRIDGPVDAKTSGGSVEIQHAGGDVSLHTSGGSINIGDALGAVDAQTSGGSIHARLAQQPRSDSRLATSGGSIVISIAPNVAVDLDAHTSGGDVDTEVPITLMGRQSQSSVEGKINGGGPRLVLRSSGGGIKLRRL